MAGLISELFRGDPRLAQCLVSDPHHVTPGTTGPFVGKIQFALLVLEGGSISGSEVQSERYGPDTAALVLAYKTKRRIINFAYQTKPDNIVGKMTIRSLDAEMLAFEMRERVSQGLQR
jgi:hypothetical protein